jgi:hypothetical protein
MIFECPWAFDYVLRAFNISMVMVPHHNVKGALKSKN